MDGHNQLPLDAEDKRLLARAEACSAQEHAATEQLAHPRQSLLFPAFLKIHQALMALRIKCRAATLAYRAHRRRRWEAEERKRRILMACNVRNRMVAEFQTSVRIYSSAIKELTAYANAATMERYDSLKLAAENARLVCEADHFAIERHTREHGC